MTTMPEPRARAATSPGRAPAEDAGSPPVPLDLTALTWRPGTRRDPTVDDLTLHVPAGQRVLLTGASGSGKSTVLLALAGLLDASTGDLSGTMPVPDRPGEHALLLQQPLHALVGATVGRDVAFGPENAALGRGDIQLRVTQALEAARSGLGADHVPWEASGGQQQRLALAGALALRPGALLLDEPTAMLDGPTARAVRRALLEAAGDRTVVVADHHIGPWHEDVDRVILLGPHATVLADGSPEDVADHLALRSTPTEQPSSAAHRRPRPHSHPHPHPIVGSDGSGTYDESDGSEQSDTSDVPGPTAAPALSFRGVSVRRRRSRGQTRREHQEATPLLEDLTFEARPGTTTVVHGPSGSGKSTLLRVVLGLDRPAEGRVTRPEPARIAYVPQEPEHAFVAPTVREELTASPWADGDLVDGLLDRADLTALAGAHPMTLSGGEKRRLAIVSALTQRPALLVLDEPTVGLDELRRTSVLDLLRTARGQGCTLLIATHDERLLTQADQRIDVSEHHVDDTDRPDDAGAAPAPDPPDLDTTLRPVRHVPRVPTDALNPLTVLVIAVAAALGSFGVRTWPVGLVCVAVLVLLAPVTVRSVRSIGWRLVPVTLAALGLWWSTLLASPGPAFSGASLLLGLKEALRITYFVAPGVLVFVSLDPTALGDALGGKLRLPGRPVAASVSGLVRAGLTGDAWRRIMDTRSVRGLVPATDARHPLRTISGQVRVLASATLALLIDALRGAEQQALAMDARGFATAQHRSWALPSRWHRADLLGYAVAVLLGVLPWLVGRLIG
jgi:energy-coupling factor transporter ATP-binding protein EcfA2/energy-coupling factor transporter transmembrane protein EcfT